ncbi:hypothetical protein O3P69_015698 [Scylla paramamosain]|uniref:Uncharacterized protein n=1 Tax=Scylla paramamosain TaxID=85552 RepID=A0AAW0S9U4_SCYPA
MVAEASRAALQAATTATAATQAALEAAGTAAAASGDYSHPAAWAETSSIVDRLEALLAPLLTAEDLPPHTLQAEDLPSHTLQAEDLHSLTQRARGLVEAGLVFAVHDVERQTRHARTTLEDGSLHLHSLQAQALPPLRRHPADGGGGAGHPHLRGVPGPGVARQRGAAGGATLTNQRPVQWTTQPPLQWNTNHTSLQLNKSSVDDPPDLPMELEESLDNPAIQNKELQPESEITFQLFEKGTQRGRDKLIDSHGTAESPKSGKYPYRRIVVPSKCPVFVCQAKTEPSYWSTGDHHQPSHWPRALWIVIGWLADLI